ncbi:probable glutathione S-transferase isoform X2 [Vitis riparia]|uniref:probable glutathione S-transferase isoform X2 n=1 Tax=Vitis riparia TaxID=96939 RepID=UPI00155A570F|nr:probable glutathione S-transferase isoform X2 [Vitis riparia]
MGEVKVLGASLSFFCCRVEWALKLKGVAYEYLEEDLRNKSPMLLQSNPVHKKVPVLVHDGRPIAESLVILEYIDEAWKGYPLLPEDPSERAKIRFWARFTDENCVLGAWAACCAKGHEREKAIESAQESLSFLQKQIEGKKFFGGETMGLLDLVVGSLPNWIEFLEEHGGMKLLDEEKFPSLYEWAQKFINIPIISERIPTKEGLINYFQGGQNSRLTTGK